MAVSVSQPRTLPPERRRKQIIEAVLQVVSRYGVPGATTGRIARAAGVAHGTLYVHFASRTEMLVAALDEIFLQMMGLIDASTAPDPLDRLKEIARRHSDLMSTESGGFALPWMEFIAAGPQAGLRQVIIETQRKVFRKLREIVEEGKAKGRIRQDVDSDQLTWHWLSFAWSENMAHVMGLDEYIVQRPSYDMLEVMLDAAAVPR
jgi:AcrR family transcriptional regulator